MKTFLKLIFLAPVTLLPVFAQAQTYSDIYGFSLYSGYPPSNYDGAIPECALVVSNNVLYGTTWEGGTNGVGGIFSVATDGSQFHELYSFSALSGEIYGNNSDGAEPYCTLLLSSNMLYGTANAGGLNGGGTIFRINTDGTGFSNIYNFGTYSGAPHAGLIISGNVLFGTSTSGGQGYGSVFRLNADGTHFTNLISFYPAATNFAFSATGELILSGSTLYGTTQGGGSGFQGTIFSLGTNNHGGYTNLFFFEGVGGQSQASTNTTGGNPTHGLVLAGNRLYGTTPAGGTNGNGVIYGINMDGSGFTNMHTFSATTNSTNYDGITPDCQLLAVGNTLYGTASAGGPAGFGSIYSINADGTGFTVLWGFPDIPDADYLDQDGIGAAGGLVESGSTLYGTSSGGGGYDGNVYGLDLSSIVPPPTLGFQINQGSLTLTWDPSKFTLQVTAYLGGEGFSDVVGATSPYVIIPTQSSAFYRLRSN